MKTSLKLLVFLGVFSKGLYAQDDVYYTPSNDNGAGQYSGTSSNYEEDYNKPAQSTQPNTNNNSSSYEYKDSRVDHYSKAPESSTYTQRDGNTYVTNNYYDYDNDYFYSSRMRRYYSPYSNVGMGYYSNYYTNSYYYNYNPYSWGVSVYNSSPWGIFNIGYPTSVVVYQNTWGWGNNWGWGGNNFCSTPYWNNHYYNSWNNPWGYYGYSSYYNPYNYNNYYGYNNYDYRNYRNSSNHYGPRVSSRNYSVGSGGNTSPSVDQHIIRRKSGEVNAAGQPREMVIDRSVPKTGISAQPTPVRDVVTAPRNIPQREIEQPVYRNTPPAPIQTERPNRFLEIEQQRTRREVTTPVQQEPVREPYTPRNVPQRAIEEPVYRNTNPAPVQTEKPNRFLPREQRQEMPAPNRQERVYTPTPTQEPKVSRSNRTEMEYRPQQREQFQQPSNGGGGRFQGGYSGGGNSGGSSSPRGGGNGGIRRF